VEYRVYYCDFERDEMIAADGAISKSVADILTLMDGVLTSAGSFVGLRDSQGEMVQFMVDEDGSICLDFPSPRERGSYLKSTTLEVCKTIVEEADGNLTRGDTAGLEFDPW
jgi:hypothetical protein